MLLRLSTRPKCLKTWNSLTSVRNILWHKTILILICYCDFKFNGNILKLYVRNVFRNMKLSTLTIYKKSTACTSLALSPKESFHLLSDAIVIVAAWHGNVTGNSGRIPDRVGTSPSDGHAFDGRFLTARSALGSLARNNVPRHDRPHMLTKPPGPVLRSVR